MYEPSLPLEIHAKEYMPRLATSFEMNLQAKEGPSSHNRLQDQGNGAKALIAVLTLLATDNSTAYEG